MEKAEMRREAQLLVLNYMMQRLYMAMYSQMGASSENIKQSHANIRRQMLQEQWPASDPGQSALVSGEIEDAFDSFLRGLEEMLTDKGLLTK